MSNKLGGVFEAPTQRNYQWPIEGGDRAEHIGPRGGRVLEILSEHACQAWLQGYLLTGRHGLFPSYESFLPIVTSLPSRARRATPPMPSPSSSDCGFGIKDAGKN